MFRIIRAETGEHLDEVRRLFREYVEWLGEDLAFQGLDGELAELPGKYAPPDGRLMLGLLDGGAVGCVAVRKLGEGVCEMKRLWVRPAWRGRGFGRRLADAIVAEARAFGYKKMRLDTLERLAPAARLYEAMGFRRIDAYYANPLDGVVYLELDLT